MVPVALAVPRVAPVEGLESLTVKPSFGSTVLSPATLTVMVLLVSPAAKLMLPEGSTPPAKSAALAGLVPEPATVQAVLAAPVVSPVRVTVKVKGVVVPAAPSALLALAAAIDNCAPVMVVSSLVMVPVALAVPRVAPVEGLESLTVKPSFGSTVLSPATLTVMVLLVSPAAKLTLPVGSTLPAKSVALAGLVPEPATVQAVLAAPVVS